MKEAAKNLQFERAAELRDEIKDCASAACAVAHAYCAHLVYVRAARREFIDSYVYDQIVVKGARAA